MKESLRFSVLALIFLFVASVGGQKTSLFPTQSSPSRDRASQIPGPLTSLKPAVDPDFGRMPLYFIANQGQVDARVAYYVQGKDKSLYFTSEGMTIILTKQGPVPKDRETLDPKYSSSKKASQRPEQWVVKLDFVKANSDVRPVGQDKTDAVISYFKGKPEEWRAGLATYSRIVYANLWPGIDLAYSGTANRLKYEFIVHPGEDPSQIRMAYRGVSGVKINNNGQLEVETPAGSFQDDRPVAYQVANGKKIEVGLGYEVEEKEEAIYSFGFRVGECDSSRPLILDPALLVYCGYIGGLGSEVCNGIAVDSSGNVYVTGSTNSTEATFPDTAGPDLTFNGGNWDAFVAKVKSDGTGLVYCGYIGGSGDDFGYGIAVNNSGNAYVTGKTSSTSATFPDTVGPYLTYNGGAFDAFVAKVNPSGTALAYCGYIGGSGEDVGYGIAVDKFTVDGFGSVYIAGYTDSTEATFPVPIGPDSTYNGGAYDAFVAKVNSTGSGLTYCGYIGGSGDEKGTGIASDSSGNAYIVGYTGSMQTTFPVAIGPELIYSGGNDAFVAKVNSTGSGLTYCGYIGGSSSDYGMGIAVDGSGNAYVTGQTGPSIYFPVTIGPDLTHNGGWDAFVAKVNSSGTGFVYSGYIGGSGDDYGLGITVDGSGSAYITGRTNSTESTFPVTLGPDLSYNSGYDDAFVAKVNISGTALAYCGYIGGSDDDRGLGIASDSSGNAYVAGWVNSIQTTFPVVIGPDLFQNGATDGFVAKIYYFMKNDFNRDGKEDILWRYYGSGGNNCVWFMGTSGGGGAGIQTADSKVVNLLRNPAPSKVYWDAREAVEPLNRTPDKIYSDAREAGGFLNGTVDKFYRDAREAGGFRSRKGALPVREGSLGNLEQRMGVQTFTTPLENMISLLGLPVLGGANLLAVADLSWHIDGTGDFNGDGNVDILWRYYGPGGYNCVWFTNGTTITGGADLPAVSDLNWQIGGTGDFNRDTKVDILWRYIGPGGYNCVWFMNGTTVTGGANLPAVDDSNWTIGGTGDFNGDTKVDILWRYIGSGGSNCVWFMNGTTVTGGANLPAIADLCWTIAGAGDFNGDGKVDILWRYYGSGGSNCVWFMSGTTITGGADLPAVSDLNWRIVNR